MRNFSGSPSFSGNFFRITAEQFSLKGVFANSISFSLLERKLLSIFWYFRIRIKASAREMLMIRDIGGEEDPFCAPHNFFVKEINEWRRHRNGRSLKNKTTSGGDGFQFTFWVSNGVARGDPVPEVEAVFIWKMLAIMFLSSLVWLDIEA
ncbi:hypothetical protein Tco_0061001 [Tanacetum coccineum]